MTAGAYANPVHGVIDSYAMLERARDLRRRAAVSRAEATALHCGARDVCDRVAADLRGIQADAAKRLARSHARLSYRAAAPRFGFAFSSPAAPAGTFPTDCG